MAVLPLSWSILELMLAHLGALAHHLASLVRRLGAHMCNNLKQNALVEPTSSKTAPKMPQPPLPSTPKVPKTKENLILLQCFSLSRHGAKIDQKCSQNHPRSSQVEPKMATLPLLWYRYPSRLQLAASFAPASLILRPSSPEFSAKSHHLLEEVPQERPKYLQPST